MWGRGCVQASGQIPSVPFLLALSRQCYRQAAPTHSAASAGTRTQQWRCSHDVPNHGVRWACCRCGPRSYSWLGRHGASATKGIIAQGVGNPMCDPWQHWEVLAHINAACKAGCHLELQVETALRASTLDALSLDASFIHPKLVRTLTACTPRVSSCCW